MIPTLKNLREQFNTHKKHSYWSSVHKIKTINKLKSELSTSNDLIIDLQTKYTDQLIIINNITKINRLYYWLNIVCCIGIIGTSIMY